MGNCVKYHFEIDEHLHLLKRSFQGWMKTPYRHRCRVKGQGCDCLNFVIGVMEDTKVIARNSITIPEYNWDFTLHTSDGSLFRKVRKQFKADDLPRRKFEYPDLMSGDILLFRSGNQDGHLGIYDKATSYVYHAVNGFGVVRSKVWDTMLKDTLIMRIRIWLTV